NFGPTHAYGNACTDLGDTINRWKNGWNAGGQSWPAVPLAITEMNFTANTANHQTMPALGDYLVDLFTWLYDHGTPRYSDVTSNRSGVMGSGGADSGSDLGIYGGKGAPGGATAMQKFIQWPPPPPPAGGIVCPNKTATVAGQGHTVANDYY